MTVKRNVTYSVLGGIAIGVLSTYGFIPLIVKLPYIYAVLAQSFVVSLSLFSLLIVRQLSQATSKLRSILSIHQSRQLDLSDEESAANSSSGLTLELTTNGGHLMPLVQNASPSATPTNDGSGASQSIKVDAHTSMENEAGGGLLKDTSPAVIKSETPIELSENIAYPPTQGSDPFSVSPISVTTASPELHKTILAENQTINPLEQGLYADIAEHNAALFPPSHPTLDPLEETTLPLVMNVGSSTNNPIPSGLVSVKITVLPSAPPILQDFGIQTDLHYLPIIAAASQPHDIQYLDQNSQTIDMSLTQAVVSDAQSQTNAPLLQGSSTQTESGSFSLVDTGVQASMITNAEEHTQTDETSLNHPVHSDEKTSAELTELSMNLGVAKALATPTKYHPQWSDTSVHLDLTGDLDCSDEVAIESPHSIPSQPAALRDNMASEADANPEYETKVTLLLAVAEQAQRTLTYLSAEMALAGEIASNTIDNLQHENSDLKLSLATLTEKTMKKTRDASTFTDPQKLDDKNASTDTRLVLENMLLQRALLKARIDAVELAAQKDEDMAELWSYIAQVDAFAQEKEKQLQVIQDEIIEILGNKFQVTPGSLVTIAKEVNQSPAPHPQPVVSQAALAAPNESDASPVPSPAITPQKDSHRGTNRATSRATTSSTASNARASRGGKPKPLSGHDEGGSQSRHRQQEEYKRPLGSKVVKPTSKGVKPSWDATTKDGPLSPVSNLSSKLSKGPKKN